MEDLNKSAESTIEILKNAIKQSKDNDKVLKSITGLLNLNMFSKRNEEGKPERILFQSNDGDSANPFNGIIFDASTAEVICRPLRRLAYNKSSEEIQRIVNKYNYKIYHAINGSVVTYYHYRGSWRISSSTGIDLNHEILIGEMTFGDIFNELLETNGISTTAFEEHNNYTFVISHPHYHILPFKKIIFIGGYNLKTKKYFNSKGSSFECIGQTVRPLGDKRTVIEKLFAEGEVSIDAYMQNQDNENPKLFGYVLRTDEPGCVDYYIRSKVMANMKAGIFSTYRSKIGQKDQRAYFMLNIWLMGQDEPFWYKIFGEEYEKYSNTFANLTVAIYRDLQEIRQKNIHLESTKSTNYTETLMKFINLGIHFENIRSVSLLDSLFCVYIESRKIKAQD